MAILFRAEICRMAAFNMDRGLICIPANNAHPASPENPVNPVKSSSQNNA
jgi:hypothetical protein